MAISYRVAGGTVLTSIDGTVTADDVRAYLRQAVTDPAYHAGMPSLVDCRQVTSLLSAEDLRAIAADIQGLTTSTVPGRCAVLAASNVVFGLLRMYEVFSEDAAIEVRAFRDLDQAMMWLEGAS